MPSWIKTTQPKDKLTGINDPPENQQNKTTTNQNGKPNSSKTIVIAQGSDNVTPFQSKYSPVFCRQMRLDSSISHHPAHETLFQYATKGCLVDCGKDWTREHLEAAIKRGPHASAKSPKVAKCLRQEALEKVAQGKAVIIQWDDIKMIHTRT